MRTFFVACILLGQSVLAQPRQYVAAPFNSFPATAQSDAVNLYELRWAELRRDTVVLCYLRQSVWFQRDSIHVQLSVDSITGRGDLRQALITRRIWKNGTERIDSLTNSRWLGYTRRVNDPEYGWYIPADSVSHASRWSMVWLRWSLSVWVEKILGSPLTNGGADQRPMLHLLYSETIPEWWRRYADSVRAGP